MKSQKKIPEIIPPNKTPEIREPDIPAMPVVPDEEPGIAPDEEPAILPPETPPEKEPDPPSTPATPLPK
mgnify:FL=1